jgi:plasmid rolling circle replication initiator protein Rep
MSKKLIDQSISSISKMLRLSLENLRRGQKISKSEWNLAKDSNDLSEKKRVVKIIIVAAIISNRIS